MAELTASVNMPVSDLMGNINRYKYNPSAIQRIALGYLAQVTNGDVNVVDPTNPFIFLLEASSVNTAAAFMEGDINIRKIYPSLAQTEDELYLHMSDKDFLNRFATPAAASFQFMIDYDRLKAELIDCPTESCYKATIARDTVITVAETSFTMQYPVDIRLYYTGVLEVSYDATIVSPIKTLSTNIIQASVLKDASTKEWLIFSVDVMQYDILTTNVAVQSSTYLSTTMEYNDSFYYCRVFNKKGNSKVWTELKTTHTDQVYDPTIPTAVLTVNESNKTCQVFIPPIYINSGLVDGSVRIDIYETKGELTINMANFALGAFVTKLQSIDDVRDITDYSNAMNNVSFTASSAGVVSGGTNGLTFEELRHQVINNAMGDYVVPITPSQLESSVDKLGFSIVKNVDVITNRIFLATKNLPKPTNENLITPANITVETLIATLDQMVKLDNVVDNGDRITILPTTLYRNVNSIISPLTKAQITALKALDASTLADNVNSNTYLYTPFHYVLDNSLNEFEARAYYLNSPTVSNLNFISQNATAGSQVNTKTYSVEKTDEGYRVLVAVTSDEAYKSIDDKNIGVQLCFVPVGETAYSYINGTLLGKDSTSGERIFEFLFKTNHDINSNNNLLLTNFVMFADESAKSETPLTNAFTILYTTSSIPTTYKEDSANSLLGTFLLNRETIVITQEKLTVCFGHALDNLWTRTRSVAAGLTYQTYQEDVPMVYEEDVYDRDPSTGSIFTFDAGGAIVYNKLHSRGDTVYDTQGNIVYLHRAGDVVLDSQGKPVSKSELYINRHIDMLFVDGAYYFATDEAYMSYRDELANVITTWVTGSLATLDKSILEQTRVFYYPKKALGLISVMVDSSEVTTIESSQSLAVTLFVPSNIYKDDAIRKKLENATIKVINAAFDNTVISVSDMTATLRATYGTSVSAFSITGLGGTSKDYKTITILNDSGRLSLAKKLMPQEDNTLVVAENVTFNFVEYSVDLATTESAGKTLITL